MPIIVTKPINFQPATDQSTAPVSNKRVPPTYEAALLELGRILMKDESFTPWMSLRKISGQCNKHLLKLPRMDFSIRALTYWAIDCADKCGEVRGPGVKVEFNSERTNDRRPEQLFLRFRQLNPDGSLA